MTEQEKELMKHFKVEELEERLEMKARWNLEASASGACTNGDCNAEYSVAASVTF